MELMIFFLAISITSASIVIRDAIKSLKKEEPSRYAVSLLYSSHEYEKSGVVVDTKLRSVIVITDNEEDAYGIALRGVEQKEGYIGKLEAKTIIKIN